MSDSKDVVPFGPSPLSPYGDVPCEAMLVMMESDNKLWQERCRSADLRIKALGDEVAALRGQIVSDDDPAADKFDPSTPEHVKISVRYHDWFRLQRMRVSAEDERDSAVAALGAVRDIFAPEEPIYNSSVVIGFAARAAADLREAKGQLAEVNRAFSEVRRLADRYAAEVRLLEKPSLSRSVSGIGRALKALVTGDR